MLVQHALTSESLDTYSLGSGQWSAVLL